MARPKNKETREKISITLPKEQVDWLEDRKDKRLFATVSHGIELCIIEAQKKYGK